MSSEDSEGDQLGAFVEIPRYQICQEQAPCEIVINQYKFHTRWPDD